MEIIHRETDYAIRAMAILGDDDKVLSAAALAERECVPIDFLRKILQRLKKAELLESTRGPSGGYRLTRPCEKITLAEIIVAIQGPLHMNACFASPGFCKNSGCCGVQDLLAEIGDKVRKHIEGITLKQIIGRIRTK